MYVVQYGMDLEWSWNGVEMEMDITQIQIDSVNTRSSRIGTVYVLSPYIPPATHPHLPSPCASPSPFHLDDQGERCAYRMLLTYCCCRCRPVVVYAVSQHGTCPMRKYYRALLSHPQVPRRNHTLHDALVLVTVTVNTCQ
jgi:hypothetical protein